MIDSLNVAPLWINMYHLKAWIISFPVDVVTDDQLPQNSASHATESMIVATQD